MVINARTRERQLIWSELDANPADPRDVTLIVRPAVNFDEGERYIVALRNLRDPAAARSSRSLPSEHCRDRKPDPRSTGAARHFEQLFETLNGQASSARSSTSHGTSPSRAARG